MSRPDEGVAGGAPATGGHREARDELIRTLDRLEGAGPAVGRPARGVGARVAVSMAARNSAPWIGSAIRSVLRQEGVDLELWVVDDASEDDTAAVVRSFRDERVAYVRHPRRRGIGAAHNTVLAESDAPLIAHVDSDDVILPGALRRVVAALAASPAAGQAYVLHYELDRDLRIPLAAFVRQRELLRRVHAPGRDVRRDLIALGMVTNHLRTYRRSALDAVGRFREDLPFGVDYEMAVRIADRFDVVGVPEFLYCQRVHGRNTQQTLRLRAARLWWSRARIVLSLLARGRGRLLGMRAPAVVALLGRGAVDALGVGAGAKAVGRALLGRRAGDS